MDILAGTLEGLARGVAAGALIGAACGSLVSSEPDELQECFTMQGATTGGGVGTLMGFLSGVTARTVHVIDDKLKQ